MTCTRPWRRITLHFSQIFLTLGRTFTGSASLVAVRDPATGQVVGGELHLHAIARKDAERSLKLVGNFSSSIGNWAVCDAIGMQALKPLVKSHQHEIFALAEKLNASKDPWQRRLSLVLVEWYTRDKKLHPQIKKLVKSLENDPGYYVKKAVVWINRNLEKGK